MLFCSEEFLIFFVVVFTIYWASPWQRLRTYLLLVSSFYFYYSWSPTLAYIVVVSSLANFTLAHWLEETRSKQRKRLCLWMSVGGNLSLLGYFKYANFFLDPVRRVLETAGFETSWPVLRIVVPIGISFYTFEAINYAVDIYRGQVRGGARPGSTSWCLSCSFPHLVAGPIVRACDFLPQIRRRKRWGWPRLQIGVQFFLMGLFKKLAIADRMAPFADPVFANPGDYGTAAAWMAVFAYTVQIYCDFSGYTDMALGSAHLLGFQSRSQLRRPVLRTQHCGLLATLAHFAVVLAQRLFVHSAGRQPWRPLAHEPQPSFDHGTGRPVARRVAGTFVAWGVLHGLLLLIHRWFRVACAALPRLEVLLATWPGLLGRMGLTYLAVCLGWVFFARSIL